MRNLIICSLLLALALNLLLFPYSRFMKSDERENLCENRPLFECMHEQFYQAERFPAWSVSPALMGMQKNFSVFFVQLAFTAAWFVVISIGINVLTKNKKTNR